MTSPHAETALMQVVVVLAAVVFICLLIGAVTACADRLKARRASRARLADQPTLAPEALDAGLARLRAELFIPAPRAGGERRAH